MKTSRREFIIGAGAVGLLHAGPSLAQSSAATDGDTLLELFTAEATRESDIRTQAVFRWYNQTVRERPFLGELDPSDERLRPSWPAPGSAPDIAPLANLGSWAQLGGTTQFQLSTSDLKWLCERNYFDLGMPGAASQFAVLGLRGASLVDGSHDSEWGRAHNLRITTPDHDNFNCVIGVWDRVLDQFRLFSGSTVPASQYMFRQATGKRFSGCNLMPTGLYSYSIGTHPATKARTEYRFKQPGSLLLSGIWGESNPDILVLRTLNDLRYSNAVEEPWDRLQPGNNIHSSIYDVDGNPETGIVFPGQSFSSAGCQVIRGSYQMVNGTFQSSALHQWREFQAALGIGADSITVDNRETNEEASQTTFPYVLLTGFDAMLASQHTRPDDYYFLRPGSKGGAVRDLWRSIGRTQWARATSDEQAIFGPSTTERVLRLQVAAKTSHTHVVHVI